MSELIDPRPVFTRVMGCDGAGKSAWRRTSYDQLPDRYYDLDAVAGGMGDCDSAATRERAAEFVDAQVDESIRKRLDFGMESAYCGRVGRDMVKRVIRAGYRVEGRWKRSLENL